MCGICGIVRQGIPVPPREIDAMNAAIAHRGPDGEGSFVHENIGLGHRRLKIIDPEAGAQPMANSSEKVHITYNGELYNFRELKAELEKKGHRFRTQSDTEVVIASYEEWGDSCVEKFRGMFAFAIVDLQKKSVFLARDPFGIKPLVYVATSDLFAFASELSALKTLPDFPREIDVHALDQFLFLQYIPAPQTAYQKAKKLPPGCTITVGFDGTVGPVKSYDHFRFHPDHFRSGDEWVEALDSAIDDSVRAHCIADVPFGAFLSGGLDSSAVVHAMSKHLSHPVHAFTIGFRENAFDETPFARQVADLTGAKHDVEIVEPDAIGILPELVRHYGEPFGDSSAVPTYYVSRLARKSVPMVLSGDGGDEAFCGYNTYRSWMQLPAEQRTPEAWFSMIQYIGRDRRMNLWKSDFHHVITDHVPAFDTAHAFTRGFEPAASVQYLDMQTYLPNCILPKVDIASMAHGLEVRTPLVDREIRHLMASVPERWNIRALDDGRYEGKLLLKRVLRKFFPHDLIDRPKQGFAVPIDKWFAVGGTLRASVEERLLSDRSPLRTFFEISGIRTILDDSRSGPMWLLLVLDEWLRQES